MIKRFSVVVLLASVFLPFWGETVCGQSASTTDFAEVSILESNKASVLSVSHGDATDLVLVNAGYNHDFCTGARCRVERAGVSVAEVIIAESRQSRAVALITSLADNETIQTGDTVKLKTI